jgi:hypothetical protein
LRDIVYALLCYQLVKSQPVHVLLPSRLPLQQLGDRGKNPASSCLVCTTKIFHFKDVGFKRSLEGYCAYPYGG